MLLLFLKLAIPNFSQFYYFFNNPNWNLSPKVKPHPATYLTHNDSNSQQTYIKMMSDAKQKGGESQVNPLFDDDDDDDENMHKCTSSIRACIPPRFAGKSFPRIVKKTALLLLLRLHI